MFQQLNRAYEVLKDKELRNQFDIFGSEGLGTSAASDKVATDRNVKRPTTVHRGRNPFYSQEWSYPPPPPPSPSQQPHRPPYEYEQSVPFNSYYNPSNSHNSHYNPSNSHNSHYDPSNNHNPSNSHNSHYNPSNSHVRQPDPHSGPRPQRPDSRFTGDSPYGSSWDPRKSPFADLYNSRMESEGYRQQNMHDSRFADIGVGFGAAAPNINMGNMGSMGNMGNTGGPTRQSMADNMNFSTTNNNSRSQTSGSGTRRRWVGGDLSIEMEVDLQTALEGGEERIRIKHLESCTPCTGNGIQPGAEVKTCEHCHGTGAITPKAQYVGLAPTENYTKQQTCPHCRGTGQTVAENCMSCHGKGVKETSKDITVLIPAGVGEGAKLRLKGEGDAGPMGGPAGDLFIFLTIKKGNAQQSVRMP